MSMSMINIALAAVSSGNNCKDVSLILNGMELTPDLTSELLSSYIDSNINLISNKKPDLKLIIGGKI